GRIEANQDAVIMPGGLATHIRTLQRHEQPSEEALAGERCAANLQGLEVADIHRGDVLARPGSLFPSDRWIVRLSCLKDSPISVRSRTEIHFHHGTLESLARVVLYDRNRLAPGETALAELRFETPVAGIFGDHCVLRAASPLRCVAGGLLVSPLPPQIRAKDPKREAKLELLAGLPGLAEQKNAAADADLTAGVIALRGAQGASLAVLRVLTGLAKKRLEKALQALSSQKKAVCFDRESQAWVDGAEFSALCSACLARAGEVHAKDPLRAGFARGVLETGWAKSLPPKLVSRVFETLLGEGRLAASGELLRLSGHSVVLDKRQQKLCDDILAAHAAGGITPPNYKDVLADLGATEKEAAPILKVLLADGDLVRVRDGLFYSAQAFEKVLASVAAWFETHDDLTVTDMKQIFGLSRKYLIALLEYLDQERYTVRIGDKRQFRSR
ncbi:MAG: SelB C-terminal domain-containing protein, partial [Desulfovibrionaceae bacterium]|nr:SelB C-terminal domain-containing protein [Desulfovibrionaceae bacterium]